MSLVKIYIPAAVDFFCSWSQGGKIVDLSNVVDLLSFIESISKQLIIRKITLYVALFESFLPHCQVVANGGRDN